MRKLYSILIAVLITVSVFAQAPNKMSYQAVVRNSSDQLVTNQGVGMKISILQGSVTGPEAYKEIYNPNPETNANGLVTLEIGSGIPLVGIFTDIDWANGLYFIKTETDPTGGTNYTITGTSQLLSVPYSFYSELAGNGLSTDDAVNVSNLSGINTGDQDLSGKVDKEAGKGLSTNDYTTAEQTKVANLSGINTGDETDATIKAKLAITDLSGTNTGDQDGSETKVTSGTNITVTGSGTIASPYVVAANTHYIGENYGGGIVFYVYDNGQHGLIAATADQSTGINWYNGAYRYTGTVGDGLGAGAMNTALIVATQIADNQTGNFAAKVCADYSITVGGITYGDWYLPSKYELNLLYLQKNVVGGLVNSYYWSSSEVYDGFAWQQSFANGEQTFNSIYSKYDSLYVRAVRAF